MIHTEKQASYWQSSGTPNEVFEPLLGFTNTRTQTDKQTDTHRQALGRVAEWATAEKDITRARGGA